MQRTVKSLINTVAALLSGVVGRPALANDRPPPAGSETRPAVALVHGFADDGTKMAWLADQFHQAGWETFCPTLTGASGSENLAGLSAQLDGLLAERFPATRELHLIGFSMGGVVARHWLGNRADLRRVRSLATLASPHHGTVLAKFASGPGSRDMRPGGDFLRKLEESDAKLADVPTLSLYTPLDLVILPSHSSVWRGGGAGKSEKVWLLIHPQVCFSRGVFHRLRAFFEVAERGFRPQSP